LEETKEKIGRWIEIDYNQLYVHSGLGYLSPEELERLYWNRFASLTTSQNFLLEIPPQTVKEVA